MTRSASRQVAAESTSAAPEPARVTVEEIGGCFLLRSADRSAEQAELAGALRPCDDNAIVVVAVPDELADALWPRLGEILARIGREPRRVVLAMSGAGSRRPGTDSLAGRISQAWKLTVVAPSGDAVLVPDGNLFAYAAPGEPEPQWWSFGPDAEPAPLGPRWPVPEWQPAVADVRTPGASGPVVVPVPAGILVLPAGTPSPAPGDLAYAIAPAADRPSILVGARVTAADLVTALSGPVARAEWRRHPLRLIPAGDGDVLPLGQAVARELGLDVEVFTGPPVDLTGSAAGLKVMVLDTAGRPAWAPFTSSVLCRPPGRDGVAPPPRPLDWRAPAPGMRVADAARGVLRLGDTWRVAVTRAGLWAYPADADPDRFPDHLTAAWPVSAATVRVDVGTADRTLDDRVWTPLEEMLGALAPDLRGRVQLVLHDPATAATAASAEVPIMPARPSDDEERAAFRGMVGLKWDAHAAPVRRTFSRLPAIAATERAAAAVDLVAVRLYLTSHPDGDFGPAAARSGGGELRPYLSCLASGLGRLPTYRGAVLRGVDAPVRADLAGTVLTEPGPVGGLPLSGEGASGYGWPPTTTVYVIWSDTARRVGALFDAGADPRTAKRGDVVFGPGSRFAVLDVRQGDADTPGLVLLRELPAMAFPVGEGTAADELACAGRLARTRLDEALATVCSREYSPPWPAHCLGPIGGSAARVDL